MVTIASWVGVDPIGCIFFPEMSVLDIFPDPRMLELTRIYESSLLLLLIQIATNPNKVIISYTCNTCLSINLSSKASLKGSLKNATPKSLIFLINGLQHLEFKQKFPKTHLGIENVLLPRPKSSKLEWKSPAISGKSRLVKYDFILARWMGHGF